MKNLLIAILVLICLSCKKEDDQVEVKTGKLKNYTGLDGCGWVIESKDEVFKPLNLKDFPLPLIDNSSIKFSFKHEPAASICMVGYTIRLISINKK